MPRVALAGQAATGGERADDLPQIENAKLAQHAAVRPLAQEMKTWVAAASEAQWLGYAVPAVDGDGVMCCGGNWSSGGNCGSCRLEDGDHGNTFTSSDSKRTIALEGPRKIIVLYRAVGEQIGKIRMVSEDCTLDAGGLHVTWLTNVNPEESVKFLSSFVNNRETEPRDSKRLGQSALAAIAMHKHPAADSAMNSFVAPERPESLRKEAAFWLGAARGASGEELLEKMAKNDPSPEVRAQVAFALSVSKQPAALDEMIRMAHDDTSSHVRGQALFWLAQKAGAKAEQAITGAIENDPDTEVKKKAVFALSQMPKDEGVPKLIEVAQTNRNPEVRKQAMFWLGQSGDPRALTFFEKILAK
ncbi:MAG TPA: HEAT repeat domain-containing protein [Terriglobales bacterium]|nr:HEAT repeat domain-containing protein [Terriglobales bacterium]